MTKYAMLFPGQGSQSVGMLAAHTDPVVADTWREASAALGYDLDQLVSAGPAEELNRTEKTQPALLAAGIALWRLAVRRGLNRPTALAGHSLGEYTALVAAGSLDFGDALRLVALRGQLMQAAVPAGRGGMTAVVGMDDEAVIAFCANCPDGVLEPANFNAPGQVVIAGEIRALDWLDANGKAAGARMVKRLAMSVPSHCSLLRGAADQLAEALEKTAIHAPSLAVLHNLDAQPRTDAAEIRAALKAQLYSPVRWTDTVRSLQAGGAGVMMECGPGKVLVGLNKRIVEGVASFALEDPAAWDQALAAVAPG